MDGTGDTDMANGNPARPSIRVSPVLSKRLDTSSNFFYSRIAPSF